MTSSFKKMVLKCDAADDAPDVDDADDANDRKDNRGMFTNVCKCLQMFTNVYE